MYNWVTRRPQERTSSPSQVFTTIVDQTVRKWMPAMVLAASACVTPARAKLDVRQYEWSPSPASWIQKVVTTVPVYLAPAQAELACYRTLEGPKLDVRRYDWDPSESVFIFKNLPAAGASTAQIAPALQQSAQSYRTTDRAKLDVRAHLWSSDFGWSDANTTAIWTPVDNAVSVRTPAARALDVRAYKWDAPESSWIAASLTPAPTQAQLWPAIQAGTNGNYRSLARPVLDVRACDWLTDAPFAPIVDTTVKSWAGVFSADSLASVRTADRGRFDVRVSWSPEAAAWITPNLPASGPSTAQILPALLANLGTLYRTAERPSLEVRRYEWAPEFGWIATPVNATLAKWQPAAQAALASFRTADRAPRIDLRGYDWQPSFAWVDLTADRVVAVWLPVFEAELRSQRTRDRVKLDPRLYTWSEFGWETVAVASVTHISSAARTSLDATVLRTLSRASVRGVSIPTPRTLGDA